jgi:hypothetical protein
MHSPQNEKGGIRGKFANAALCFIRQELKAEGKRIEEKSGNDSRNGKSCEISFSAA